MMDQADTQKEQLLTTDQVAEQIKNQNIQGLQPSEIQALVNFCDRSNRGIVVTSSFAQKVNEIA